MTAPRVRFCPAPSGWLHVGGARTALYNWLYARQNGGTFILRMEDTDADRATRSSADQMMEGLRFLGLDWDEGPGKTGAHGPYFQSERTDLYKGVANALLQAGRVYPAFETEDELKQQREQAMKEGRPPGYSGAHRDLTQEQIDAYVAEGRTPVLRVRTPDSGVIGFHDAVRGQVEFDWKDIPDFVVQRADGSTVYFLANAADDIAMGVNFIARGEDLLSATPRQLLLYQLLTHDGLIDTVLADLGYPARPADAMVPPRFAHLPLLVGEDRKPLSKRHGSVAIDEFRRQGFLPEVLLNFLALCGWSFDGVQERFTPEELVEKFSFDRVSKNPAFFDVDKLRSMNGDRIKELTDAELAERLLPYLNEAGALALPPTADEQRLLSGLAPLLRERIQTLAEAAPLVASCFAGEVAYDEQSVAKHLKGRAGEVLDAAAEALEALGEWTAESITAALDGVSDRLELGRGKTYQPVRVAVAGSAVSPPLPETLALLDRQVVLARVRAARPLVHD